MIERKRGNQIALCMTKEKAIKLEECAIKRITIKMIQNAITHTSF